MSFDCQLLLSTLINFDVSTPSSLCVTLFVSRYVQLISAVVIPWVLDKFPCQTMKRLRAVSSSCRETQTRMGGRGRAAQQQFALSRRRTQPAARLLLGM